MIIEHVTETDREILQNWISRDRFHRKTFSPDMFILPAPEDGKPARATSCMFADRRGPVMFVRFTSVMRVQVQFDPGERLRTAGIMLPAFEWVVAHAEQSMFSQVVARLDDKELRAFCRQRLGFKSRNEYFRGVI